MFKFLPPNWTITVSPGLGRLREVLHGDNEASTCKHAWQSACAETFKECIDNSTSNIIIIPRADHIFFFFDS